MSAGTGAMGRNFPLFRIHALGVELQLAITDPDADGNRSAHLGLQFSTHGHTTGRVEIYRHSDGSAFMCIAGCLSAVLGFQRNLNAIVGEMRILCENLKRDEEAFTGKGAGTP